MKMNDQRDGLPVRRYEYVNHHILDSNRWNQFTHRPGDIIISTSYKAGTTWMQTIVANLVFQDGAMPQPVLLMSPWLDMRHRPLDAALVNLDGQTHRRFIKSHLPLDALPYYPAARYIIVGRDPRDVFMSLLAHHGNYTAEAIAQFNSVSVEIGREFPVDLGEASHAWRNWLTRGSFSWERRWLSILVPSAPFPVLVGIQASPQHLPGSLRQNPRGSGEGNSFGRRVSRYRDRRGIAAGYSRAHQLCHHEARLQREDQSTFSRDVSGRWGHFHEQGQQRALARSPRRCGHGCLRSRKGTNHDPGRGELARTG